MRGERRRATEKRKWKTRWRSKEEGGWAPRRISLNAQRRSLSPPLLPFHFTRTHTGPERHTGVLLQLNRRSMEPRLRGSEDSSLHEPYPWKPGMRREKRRTEEETDAREKDCRKTQSF